MVKKSVPTAKELAAQLKASRKVIPKGVGKTKAQAASSAAANAKIKKEGQPKPVEVLTSKGKRAVAYVPGSGDPKKPFRFAKGQSGNPAGRGEGVRTTLNEAKMKFIANTGMTPLEFLVFVYRDELFTAYDTQVIDARTGTTFVHPKLGPDGEVIAEKVKVDMAQRLAAATAAAPYIHRKKPIGIDGGEGKPISFVSAESLGKLTDSELSTLLAVMDKLGIGAEFAGHEPKMYTLENTAGVEAS